MQIIEKLLEFPEVDPADVPLAETCTAPAEHTTPAPAVHAAPELVIEYVAPEPVNTDITYLLKPPVPVVQVVQVPEVQDPQLQAQTSESLGTAPVSQMKPAEVVEVAGLGHLSLPSLFLRYV